MPVGVAPARQALVVIHHERALAQPAAAITLSDPNLEKIRGDATKAKDVEAALVGVDVVIQIQGVGLGGLCRPLGLLPDAIRVLIAAMRGHGVKRRICVPGFGAGDCRPNVSCLRRLPFQVVFGQT